jgi:hypothetical protein
MDLHLVRQPRERFRLAGALRPADISLAEVDWATEVALVIDLGERRTGGWSVRVKDVSIPAPDQVELTLDVQAPRPGSMAIQAFTRPYALCRLKRTALAEGPLTVVARDPSGREILRQVVQS